MLIKEKERFVAEFVEKIKATESMILVYYQGLNVNSINELRSSLIEAGCTMQVIKNRLALKAIEESGIKRYEQLRDKFTGPTAVLLASEDPTAAIKVFKRYVTENKLMEFRAAVIGENLVEGEGLMKIADLPSREVLIAKLVMLMNSPIQGFYNGLSGVIKKLMYALNDLKDKKSDGSFTEEADTAVDSAKEDTIDNKEETSEYISAEQDTESEEQEVSGEEENNIDTGENPEGQEEEDGNSKE